MSTNGGAVWKELNKSLDEGYAIATASGVLYAGGSLVESSLSKMAVIKLTTDGTLTRTSILTAEAGEVKALAIHPANPAVIYAGGIYRDQTGYNYSRLFKSTDAGLNWIETGKTSFNVRNDGIYGLCFDPRNPSKLLAATTTGVMISENNGATWSAATQRLSCTSILADPSTPNRYFIGTRTGIYGSADGGKSWLQLGTQLSNKPILSLAIDKQSNVLYAGTEGQGVFRYSLSTTDIADYATDIPGEFALYQNYPNPFNPATTIRFSLNRHGMCRLSIFSLLGQEVDVLVNRELTAGTHSVRYDAGMLPSGIYFYKLQNAQGTLMRKLALIK